MIENFDFARYGSDDRRTVQSSLTGTPGRQPVDVLPLAPPLERRRLQCYLAMMVADAIVLLAGFASANYLHTGSGNALQIGPLVLPIYLGIALYNGAYSTRALRQASAGISRALAALAISTAGVVFIAFFTKSSAEFSRAGVTLGVIMAGLAIAWTRMQLRTFIAWRCGPNVINELIIDDGGPDVTLPGAIRASANQLGISPNINDPHALDRVGLVLRNIDRVVVSCRPERRQPWAMILKGANISGEVLDDSVAVLGAQGARIAGDYGWLLVSSGPLGIRDRAIKRLFDVIISALALIALSPLMLAIAAAIKVQDGGPALFSQRRMGRGNCFFTMYKFRSMAVAREDRDGTISAARHDARVTRLGALLRRTSLDELPQLINVLIGDMSLVGPRPHAIGSLAGNKMFWEVDSRYWQRHSLKPGMSGLAQIRGFRGATDHEQDLVNRLHSDLEYLEGWTIFRDLRIVAMTLNVVVHDRAY